MSLQHIPTSTKFSLLILKTQQKTYQLFSCNPSSITSSKKKVPSSKQNFPAKTTTYPIFQLIMAGVSDQPSSKRIFVHYVGCSNFEVPLVSSEFVQTFEDPVLYSLIKNGNCESLIIFKAIIH